MNLARLRDPFPEGEVEWRIGRSGMAAKGPWAMCLAYLTNRAIMDRLDDAVGPANWQNKFTVWALGEAQLCGIGIWTPWDQPAPREGQWVWKWDGAPNTDFEAVKGGLSDSMKRAAVQWGIGRYLYGLESTFSPSNSPNRQDGWIRAKVDNKTVYFQPPTLPPEFLPKAGGWADPLK